MTANLWEGKLVRLRGLRPDDWEAFWANDKDTEAQRYGWRLFPPQGIEAAKKWAMEESLARPEDDARRFVIETLEGVNVGTINTHDCDRLNRRFSYGVALWREHWGKRYAAEAITIVCRYMFEELGYHKVYAWVYAFNERSKRMHEKLGMVLEGTARQAHFTAGAFHDEHLFGMMATEFFDLYGRELLI